MYKHILIPTDGSELSKMALPEGVALAKALGGRVTVVTVTTPFHVFMDTPTMVTDVPPSRTRLSNTGNTWRLSRANIWTSEEYRGGGGCVVRLGAC